MVEKIYLNDSYAKEITANVTSITKDHDIKEVWLVELDKTVFYPGGGGELPDTGTMTYQNSDYEISIAVKKGDGIAHLTYQEPKFIVGDQVFCKIDWAKRYRYMRHHTAIHVIAGIMEEKYNAMFTGGMIGFSKSHFDFDMPQLNRELAEEIVNESQSIIDKNLNVIIKILTKEEALKIPNLVRTEPGKELLKKLDTVRVVEIESFDMQMDGGTHVKNTSEIGKVSLSSFENKGTHRKRIEIMVD